jgi:hypothetical protein
MTDRQKNRKTERQNDKMTKRQKRQKNRTIEKGTLTYKQ